MITTEQKFRVGATIVGRHYGSLMITADRTLDLLQQDMAKLQNFDIPNLEKKALQLEKVPGKTGEIPYTVSVSGPVISDLDRAIAELDALALKLKIDKGIEIFKSDNHQPSLLPSTGNLYRRGLSYQVSLARDPAQYQLGTMIPKDVGTIAAKFGIKLFERAETQEIPTPTPVQRFFSEIASNITPQFGRLFKMRAETTSHWLLQRADEPWVNAYFGSDFVLGLINTAMELETNPPDGKTQCIITISGEPHPFEFMDMKQSLDDLAIKLGASKGVKQTLPDGVPQLLAAEKNESPFSMKLFYDLPVVKSSQVNTVNSKDLRPFSAGYLSSPPHFPPKRHKNLS